MGIPFSSPNTFTDTPDPHDPLGLRQTDPRQLNRIRGFLGHYRTERQILGERFATLDPQTPEWRQARSELFQLESLIQNKRSELARLRETIEPDNRESISQLETEAENLRVSVMALRNELPDPVIQPLTENILAQLLFPGPGPEDHTLMAETITHSLVYD